MDSGNLYKVEDVYGTYKPDLPKIKRFLEEVFALGEGALLGPYKIENDFPGELEIKDWYGKIILHRYGVGYSDYKPHELEGTLKMFAAAPSINARTLIIMGVLLDALEEANRKIEVMESR